MTIIVNKIPVSLLNRDYEIYIQPCPVQRLQKFNQTESFTVYDKGFVMYGELKKHFSNLLLDEERTLSIDGNDNLIFAIKTGNGYVFNQLVLD